MICLCGIMPWHSNEITLKPFMGVPQGDRRLLKRPVRATGGSSCIICRRSQLGQHRRLVHRGLGQSGDVPADLLVFPGITNHLSKSRGSNENLETGFPEREFTVRVHVSKDSNDAFAKGFLTNGLVSDIEATAIQNVLFLQSPLRH